MDRSGVAAVVNGENGRSPWVYDGALDDAMGYID